MIHQHSFLGCAGRQTPGQSCPPLNVDSMATASAERRPPSSANGTYSNILLAESAAVCGKYLGDFWGKKQEE